MLLFCRETDDGEFGARPYVFLGPVRYVSHTGSRTMAITWKLDHPMTADSWMPPELGMIADHEDRAIRGRRRD